MFVIRSAHTKFPVFVSGFEDSGSQVNFAFSQHEGDALHFDDLTKAAVCLAFLDVFAFKFEVVVFL